jgi:hypothetical protein
MNPRYGLRTPYSVLDDIGQKQAHSATPIYRTATGAYDRFTYAKFRHGLSVMTTGESRIMAS